MPWQVRREHPDTDVRTEAKVEILDAISEWDYGDYEGVTSKDIAQMREKEGLGPWDIWRDGCPGGE
jgi:broad specificity phosphatase PhoE